MKHLLIIITALILISCSNERYPRPTGHQFFPDTAVPQVRAPLFPANTVDRTCPAGMVLVDGDYCPNVQEHCKYNVDMDGKPKPGPADLLWACGEFGPTTCLSETVHKRFCIDKYEFPNREGQLPQDWMTWYDVKNGCEAESKRLCTASEWTLAAQGPNMHPLPYGDGYHRDKTICNFDNPIKNVDPSKAKKPHDKMAEILRSFLVASGAKPQCASDYGVHDMAGNVDEWVINEASNLMECPKEMRQKKQCANLSYHSGLKGGHIWHVRNASTPMTTAHYPGFAWYETGGRCCANP